MDHKIAPHHGAGRRGPPSKAESCPFHSIRSSLQRKGRRRCGRVGSRKQTPGGGSNLRWSTDKPQTNQYDLTLRPAERQWAWTKEKQPPAEGPRWWHRDSIALRSQVHSNQMFWSGTRSGLVLEEQGSCSSWPPWSLTESSVAFSRLQRSVLEVVSLVRKASRQNSGGGIHRLAHWLQSAAELAPTLCNGQNKRRAPTCSGRWLRRTWSFTMP